MNKPLSRVCYWFLSPAVNQIGLPDRSQGIQTGNPPHTDTATAAETAAAAAASSHQGVQQHEELKSMLRPPDF